ncbi:multimodular transpeptidase-transglycosylase [Streptomyces laurentii]|uniref:Multimodular transpeptidase-transglycosylase n=1 Tax=Streptomyces laurentii TaxID=39478 RepID=A0A160NZZ6_STRLU|nr:multimodular transpeptidase-transglycosylase [Streptomyces laurentii]
MTGDAPPPDPAAWEPRDPTVPAPAAEGPPSPPDGPTPRNGRGRKARKPRSRRRRILHGLLAATTLGALLLLGTLVAGYLLVDIPAANATAVAQSNVFLYRDGSTLARSGDVDRENVSLARVPLTVQHAVFAAEERDFRDAPAVDPRAMLRATWNTLRGRGRQSGSTITQQYVKNYYLGQEQTLTRKAKEFFISLRVGHEKTKDEILEGYLNTSYFGRNAYGIQAAAHAYYGKNAKDLGIAEGAYLASLLNSPNAYDVATHPENRARALARWRYVLDGMVKEGWLTPAARDAATFPTPKPVRATAGLSGQRGYLVQAVEQYLDENGVVDEKTFAAGGFRVTTTLDPDRQQALADAVEERVTSRLDPARNPADRWVRVGGAAIDPATGDVVALYGGIDYTRQYVNNATRRDYQVGSTFKPFVLATALQHEARTQDGEPITPNTLYNGDNKRPVRGWTGAPYDPANEDDTNYGDITLRQATDQSVNAVYAQLAVDAGPARVRRTAVDLGLPTRTPDLTASPSIALGPATASVLDLTQAYATLANHGTHGTYTLVAKVTRDGTDLTLPRAKHPAPVQALGREAADTTTSVLRGVVDDGTGTAALTAGRPAAGKTGTAEDDKAAWFAGYTPDLAAVIAMMGQDPKTGRQLPLYGALGQRRINGGGAPAEIWGRFVRDALADTPPKDFDLQLMDGAEPPEPSASSPAGQGHEGPQHGPRGRGTTPNGGRGGQGQTPGQSPGQVPGQGPGHTRPGGPTHQEPPRPAPAPVPAEPAPQQPPRPAPDQPYTPYPPPTPDGPDTPGSPGMPDLPGTTPQPQQPPVSDPRWL